MLRSTWATIHQGEIRLAEKLELPDGTKLLVTVLPDDEGEFWQATSEQSLAAIWDNAEDDAYAQLLKE